MEYLISICSSIAQYMLFIDNMNVNDIISKIVAVIIIAVVNAIVIPIIKFVFNVLIKWLKTKQKTPENDNEFVDILIEGAEDTKNDIVENLENLEVGDKENDKNKNN